MRIRAKEHASAVHIVPTRKPSMPPSRHQPQPRVRRIERGYTTMQPASVPTQRYLLASQWTPAHTAQAGTLSRLAQSAFINPNFAKLWWGQAISSVGDYAWDT